MTSRTHSGFGTFFFPAAVVYDDHTMETRMDKPPDHLTRDIVLIHDVSPEIKILVTDDAFICPIMTGDREAIHEFLNVIFATFTTKFHQCHYMVDQDFSGFIWNEGAQRVKIGLSRGVFSLRNLLGFERDDENTFSLWQSMPRQEISVSLMKGLLDQAYRFYIRPEFKDPLLLICEAWSLSFDEMHTASFLYAWMIIENYLEEYWDDYVDSLGRAGVDRDALKNHNSWTVSHYIETLSFVGKIDAIGRDALNKLRKIRNSVVHDGKKITKDEAYDCMSVAVDILYNRLNEVEPFHEIKLKTIR